MKILLTGANGYIGRRLKYALMDDSSVDLRLFVTNERSVSANTRAYCEIAVGNSFDTGSLDRALEGVETAYYLIHSLAAGKNFRELDKISAQNFLDACVRQGVKRIIYLGGLGEKETASEHLISRIETGEILSAQPDKVQCVWIRAGMIVGSGSASFEILRNLVEKLPVMVTPKWVDTPATAVCVKDVIRYLDDSRRIEPEGNLVVDIGGEEMTYGDMLKQTAEVMGLNRRFVSVPFLSPKFSSYWLMLLSPVNFKIASSLIEGLRSPVTLQNDNARTYFDFEPSGFRQAVGIAIEEIVNNQVVSRWSDAGGEVWERDHKKDIANALFLDRREVELADTQPGKVYESFRQVGGANGWFSYNFLWEVRGVIDKLFGGAGINRGRRDSCDLRIGDCLDFWKVVELKENERLLLFAQMKVPGKAWLEFKIEGKKFIQTAYFYPKGLLGRLYWYVLEPVHYFIFRDMAKQIVDRAKTV